MSKKINNNSNISITELKKAFNNILNVLEACEIDHIEIDEDYYWYIPKEKIYNMMNDPGDFTIGQLSDDLNEIKKIANNEKEAILYAFVWLSSIIRYIGETDRL